jgi:hypothetical protein
LEIRSGQREQIAGTTKIALHPVQPLLRIRKNLLCTFAEYGAVLFLFLLSPPLSIHIILELKACLPAWRRLSGLTVVGFIVTRASILFIFGEKRAETSHVSTGAATGAAVARLW